MSLGALPHTPNSALPMPLDIGVHELPSELRMTPFCPTATRLVGDHPQMPQISVGPFAFVIADHCVPSNRSIAPLAPVAYTWVASSPHTSSSVAVVPLCIGVQAVPS